MTAVLHVWAYGRFIEIQSNLSRIKLIEQIKTPIFLELLLAIEVIKEPQSKLEENVNPSILKDDFSSRREPPIFTSIAPVLLDWSNETR